MRWVLVGGATATSGLFVMANLRAPVFENAGPKALPVYLTMGGLHLALGAPPGFSVLCFINAGVQECTSLGGIVSPLQLLCCSSC